MAKRAKKAKRNNNKNNSKNHKNKEGRPTKYKPKYCQAIIKFFTVEPYDDIELPHYDEKGKIKWKDYKRMPNRLPFFADFAASIGVTDATVVNWTKSNPEFLSAYMRAKELQKQHLITCGLEGLYPPKFAVFTACNITDMSDEQKTTHGVTDSLAQLLREISGSGSGLSITEGKT